MTGESIVRHLRYGRAAIAAVFPEAVVDTYAVQEPCWSSCLPGLLQSFGYKRAALPHSTCWGGYHAGRADADLCHWTGPDGAAITTAPRYGIDGLVGPATEENAVPPAGYGERCHRARIAHPAGTILQDAGWPARPWAPGHEQGRPTPPRPRQHVTWRQYVDTIAEPAEQPWPASAEDLRVGLVWGATVVQRIAQVCRAGENEVGQTEKLAAIAAAHGQAFAYPANVLRELWIDVLLSQHHDVWIVPYNRNNVGTWASECDARYAHGHRRCLAINRSAMAAMSGTTGRATGDVRRVRVFNTTGFGRADVAAVDVVSDPGTVAFRVRDGDGPPVACQPLVRRRFASDGSVNAATVVFPADVPAAGYATYTVEPIAGRVATELLAPTTKDVGATVDARPDGTVVIDTDLYWLTLDPARGGAVRALLVKAIDGGREFVDRRSPRAFNEYRGFFPDAAGTGGAWLSSVDAKATVEAIESGPVRVAVKVTGHVGPYPFTTLLTLAQGQRPIDVAVAFDFPVDGLPFEKMGRPQRVRVGEPWPFNRDATRSDRRPFYDSSYKLRALFPAAVGDRPAIDKNAPFDVCRSGHIDTRFDRWSAIKNNVVVNWVDVVAGDGSAGMAVMSDHTTAYDHGDLSAGGEPLGLVLGYSGLGDWADVALGRPIKVGYAVVPHAGDWASGRLWRELVRSWSHVRQSTDGHAYRRDSRPTPHDRCSRFNGYHADPQHRRRGHRVHPGSTHQPGRHGRGRQGAAGRPPAGRGRAVAAVGRRRPSSDDRRQRPRWARRRRRLIGATADRSPASSDAHRLNACALAGPPWLPASADRRCRRKPASRSDARATVSTSVRVWRTAAARARPLEPTTAREP